MSGDLARHATDLGEVDILDSLRRLEAEGVLKTTPVSLTLKDADLGVEEYLNICTAFAALRNASAWYIADLLCQGDFLHGFRASQAEAVLGREPETLRRWQWVADKVPKSRRNPRLSFSHHEEVAKLDPPKQVYWLARAEEDRLTVGELRAHIKHSRSTSNTSGSPESADPNPTSAKVVEARETGAEGLCPTCGQRWPEQLPVVDVKPDPKRPSWG